MFFLLQTSVSWEYVLRMQAEVLKARVPIANRDFCVDTLIPLNECRRKNYYLPWKCEEERHAYELCQYKEYKLRTQK